MMNSNEFMLGVDFSHYQWDNGKFNPTFLNFVILKATEGKSYVDPKLNDWLKLIANTDSGSKPFIFFYHYARPENNYADVEVKHFIDVISPHIGNCGLVLDYEGDALHIKDTQEWALEWLTKVKHTVGNRALPLFYTSSSYTKKFPKIAESGFPLWVAHYNIKQPKVDCWKSTTMWQFTSKPFDINIFFGTPTDMINLIHSY